MQYATRNFAKILIKRYSQNSESLKCRLANIIHFGSNAPEQKNFNLESELEEWNGRVWGNCQHIVDLARTFSVTTEAIEKKIEQGIAYQNLLIFDGSIFKNSLQFSGATVTVVPNILWKNGNYELKSNSNERI